MRISDWSSDVCSSDLGHAADRAGTGYPNDAAGAARAHRRQQRLGQQHRAEQIGREHLLPRVVGELLDAADAGDAGVVHQHVRCADRVEDRLAGGGRSEEHTSELQSLMRISYAVFCLKKKTTTSEDE